MSKTDTRPLIAKVKIGQKQLGLDEATYRAMLFEITGKESAALCNQVQLARVIDHMASKGAVFSAKGKKGDQPYRTGAARRRSDFYEIPDGVPFAEQKRHIAGMWKQLGYDLLSLDSRVAKQFGVKYFIWLKDQSQLQTLGRDIKKRLDRKLMKQATGAATA